MLVEPSFAVKGRACHFTGLGLFAQHFQFGCTKEVNLFKPPKLWDLMELQALECRQAD
jgi:hypothetical protein